MVQRTLGKVGKESSRGKEGAREARISGTAGGTKHVTADEAVRIVKSGDRVGMGWGPNEAPQLIQALARRAPELRDVEIADILGGGSMGPLLDPQVSASFRAWTSHIGEPMRSGVFDGRSDFAPPTYGVLHRHGHDGRRDFRRFDVYMVKVSPPDENGNCSFGRALWLHKFNTEKAIIAIGEIDPTFIRTGGDNFIHVSAFDYLVEPAPKASAGPSMFGAGGPRAGREPNPTIDTIGGHFASLIRDGDTLQFGAGKVSGAMPLHLFDKHDLGIHTEACPGMVVNLVKAGVVTGKRKAIHTGKVIASVFGVSDEDAKFVENNPMWELYDINYVDNPLVIALHDNFVAVNTCLEIDLTGQVNSESFGAKMYSGAGGQPDFAMGAIMSNGGRGIHVLQSTARNGTVSTLVPVLAAGSSVTVSRNYVDFVVTEYGIASLQGKTIRERAAELIGIAHPDFRAELRREAQRVYGWSV